ncbi:MAG TPA: SUMF1/EgtB/PvdO family nonheme iron enzyme [Thermoanaerobaculia bacterium]|nr:SUMF1/EgtB/PvdO family nonheme iron enzyme [Thermoanaerobaculia bacterium]
MTPQPAKVFISYSHKDEAWKDRVVSHLQVLAHQGLLAVWDDRQIDAGDDWYAAIESALESCDVALLLISRDFLNSGFIRREEVPRLLRRREEAGVRVIPVILWPCSWDQVDWLKPTQARPTDGKPLASFKRKAEAEQALADLAKEVLALAGAPADPRRGGAGDAHAAELRRTTELYLQHLSERHRYLPLQGMGVIEKVPLRLPLLEMYVPLTARCQLPEGQAWARGLRLAGRAPTAEEAEAMGERLSERLPILDLLRAHDGLVVLGDPGAGKTTFLKYLALMLSTGRSEELGLGSRLPILVPLAAYAEALAAGDLPLGRFFAQHYRERGVDLPLEAMLSAALALGGALLLLDGLDEVKDLGQRHLVAQRVQDFYASHRRAGNKFVLTCRIVGYPEVRWRGEGLAECTLVDFEDEEIEAFVEKWTQALEKAAYGEGLVAAFEAAREKEGLLTAVRSSPGVRGLASNPLLLTILALMKRQGVELPERRVQLYANCVEVLLKHWNLARGLSGRPGPGLDLLAKLRLLAPLALWMQRTSPGAGLVREPDLVRELEAIHERRGDPTPAESAERFLAEIQAHSSLLVDRGGRQLGFLHLTFQEYLAAVALAQQGQLGVAAIVEELAAHVGDPAWEEVSRLVIGYLGVIQGREDAAGLVISELLERRPGPGGEVTLLAARAVLDAGPGGVPRACREQVLQVLTGTLVAHGQVDARRRAEAGRLLASLGDPRRGATTLDEMEFCFVPAGPFTMGSAKDDPKADEDERPQHRCEVLHDFWMARFPLTGAQWRQYVGDSRRKPEDERSLDVPANEPAAWVTWEEALACCRWLTSHWRERGLLPKGWEVRLPSEAEWEKAARGGHEVPRLPRRQVLGRAGEPAEPLPLRQNEEPARSYPWGEGADPDLANFDRSRIARPSAVGCFPLGASPYGVEELSGNVYEWTRTLWRKDEKARPFEYPYRTDDGREDEGAGRDAPRVVRGGSSFNSSWGVRSAYRDWVIPGDRDVNLGFRVVLSPFFSEP